MLKFLFSLTIVITRIVYNLKMAVNISKNKLNALNLLENFCIFH
jgi:hypothetical protein